MSDISFSKLVDLSSPILAVLLASAGASAAERPPRYIIEPALGLRLEASAKLEPLPADVSVLCSRDSDKWIYHEWILAHTFDAATTYYVASGYAERRNPSSGQALYEPIVRGGLYAVIGNKCMGDPADESFEALDFDQTPLPVLQLLARDLAAPLVQTLGGPDKLRSEIKHQRVDFKRLPPELQEVFKPYFEPAK